MNNIDCDPMIPLDFNLTDDTKDAIAVTVYIIKDGKAKLDIWLDFAGRFGTTCVEK